MTEIDFEAARREANLMLVTALKGLFADHLVNLARAYLARDAELGALKQSALRYISEFEADHAVKYADPISALDDLAALVGHKTEPTP